MSHLNITPILTCEHASNGIPEVFSAYLPQIQSILDTHQGWDMGAMHLCQALQTTLKCNAYYGNISRLLIDLNRSTTRDRCFSMYTREASSAVKMQLLEDYYHPFRSTVRQKLDQLCQHLESQAIILHLSVHSFTPELNGNVRKNDIGLLYDPKRQFEKNLALQWKQLLTQQMTKPYKVSMNQPYLGTADGHTTALRKIYPEHKYIGIELEVNQKHLTTENAFNNDLLNIIVGSFVSLIQSDFFNPNLA